MIILWILGSSSCSGAVLDSIGIECIEELAHGEVEYKFMSG